MNDCYCDDETRTIEDECVICKNNSNRLMLGHERRWKCHKIISGVICGSLDFICDKCELSGWSSTAGCGGRTSYVNEKTKEKRFPVRNNYDSGDDSC